MIDVGRQYAPDQWNFAHRDICEAGPPKHLSGVILPRAYSAEVEAQELDGYEAQCRPGSSFAGPYDCACVGCAVKGRAARDIAMYANPENSRWAADVA